MNKKLKVTQTFTNGVATQVHHIPETGQGSVHRKSGFWIFRMDTFRQIPHPPTMRYFEFYNISNLVYHFLSPLLLPYTPTASPSTFPMLSLITRSAWPSREVADLLIRTSLFP